MNAEDDGVRYSSRELFDIFLEFLRDKRERVAPHLTVVTLLALKMLVAPAWVDVLGV